MKTLGILGGMGPEASSYFYQLITKRTPARCDQDHVPILLYSATQLPDRAPEISHPHTGPVSDGLKAAAQLLERSGAQMIAIPCNTAHYFIEPIQGAVAVPVLNMIHLTVAHIVKQDPKAVVGLVGTIATMSSGLYVSEFEAQGLSYKIPSQEGQDICQKMIYSIKSGEDHKALREAFLGVLDQLRHQGATLIILGCTELPLLFPQGCPSYTIDPMVVLADACISRCKSQRSQ